MELEILHAIQSLQTDWLNTVMITVSALGNVGIIWIILSILLLPFKKTRKCGITIICAMALSFLLGNVILKNLIARQRPFYIAPEISLLIPIPSEYSFPSGHTLNGFTASVVLFHYFRKPGIAALVLATLIAFSRMYLFVHYPSDIIAGIFLGIFDAVFMCWVVEKLWARFRNRRKASDA